MVKRKKNHDKLIEQLYYKHAQGLEISILDIPKLFAYCEEEINRGADPEATVKAAIAEWCAKHGVSRSG